MGNSKLFLDKLTILIPSVDRREILIQNLQFFDRVCKIFVCEHSDRGLTKSEQSKIPPNVEWINGPEDVEDRNLMMAQKVETEFCSLMCDDEIMLPDSLAVLISFLEDNTVFSYASGMAVAFAKNKTKKMWGSNLLFSHAYHELKQRSLIMEDPRVRALIHSNFYTLGSSYAVHRTSNFICAMRNAQIAKSCARYSSEIAFELSHVLLGKSVVLPIVCWMRNYEVQAIREVHPDKPQAGNLPEMFKDWWNKSASEKEKKALVLDLATTIANRSHLSKNALISIIDESLSFYGKPLNLKRLARVIGTTVSKEQLQVREEKFNELSKFNNPIPYLDEETAKKSFKEQGILFPSRKTWNSVSKHLNKLDFTAGTQ